MLEVTLPSSPYTPSKKLQVSVAMFIDFTRNLLHIHCCHMIMGSSKIACKRKFYWSMAWRMTGLRFIYSLYIFTLVIHRQGQELHAVSIFNRRTSYTYAGDHFDAPLYVYMFTLVITLVFHCVYMCACVCMLCVCVVINLHCLGLKSFCFCSFFQ